MSKSALHRDLAIVQSAAQTAGELVGRFAREIDQRFKVLESRFETLARVPGPQGPAGQKGLEGPPGPPGPGGADGEPGAEGATGERGEPGKPGADAKGWVPRGVFDEKKGYERFDVIAKDGASWVALADDPGPLPGPGWQLIARQGRTGAPGERGERGEPGKPGLPGKDGRGVEDIVRGDNGQLVFVMTDGDTLELPE